MPILGICRGVQALNVARGGTLHQHVPAHRQTEPATATTHDGARRGGSQLAALVRARPLRVNSFHHQAVDRLASGLRAVAHAADGTIEAVEAPGRASCSACSGTPRGWWASRATACCSRRWWPPLRAPHRRSAPPEAFLAADELRLGRAASGGPRRPIPPPSMPPLDPTLVPD